MKNIKLQILTAFIFLSFFNSKAEETGRFYQLKASSILVECNINGDSISKYSVKAKLKFTIEDETSDFYIIRFWDFDTTGVNATLKKPVLEIQTLNSTNKLPNYLQYNVNPTNNKTRYFRINKNMLDFYAKPIVPKYSSAFGTVTTPFKYRPSKSDFTKDLTLSGMGGVRRHIDASGRHSLIGLVGIGLSSVTLDSFNTDGKVNLSSDKAAITLSFSLVYQYEKVQFGLVGGFDYLPKRSVENWAYQGKFWIGFGVGYSIFSSEAEKTDEGGNQ
jgi:hypothetical protein